MPMKLRKPTDADLKDYNHQQSLKLPSGREIAECLSNMPYVS